MAFDDLDRQIVALMRRDARMAAATPATKLDTSRVTIANRLRGLEDEGLVLWRFSCKT